MDFPILFIRMIIILVYLKLYHNYHIMYLEIIIHLVSIEMKYLL